MKFAEAAEMLGPELTALVDARAAAAPLMSSWLSVRCPAINANGTMMCMTITYRADVHREGDFWLIHVPEIDCHTQARDPAEIEPMARDLIAIMEEVAPDSFRLDIRHA